MTTRQVFWWTVLFVAALALGYGIGAWYWSPRPHHALVEVLSC